MDKNVDAYFVMHTQSKAIKNKMDQVGDAIKENGPGEYLGQFALAKVIKPANSKVFNYKLGYEMVLAEIGKVDPAIAQSLRKKAEKKFTETRINALRLTIHAINDVVAEQIELAEQYG